MCVLEIYFYRPIHMHGADSISAITNVFYRLLTNFTAKFCALTKYLSMIIFLFSYYFYSFCFNSKFDIIF